MECSRQGPGAQPPIVGRQPKNRESLACSLCLLCLCVCVCVWATRFHWAGRDSTRKSSPATLSSSLELADLGRLF